jgi:hypothetical protein
MSRARSVFQKYPSQGLLATLKGMLSTVRTGEAAIVPARSRSFVVSRAQQTVCLGSVSYDLRGSSRVSRLAATERAKGACGARSRRRSRT